MYSTESVLTSVILSADTKVATVNLPVTLTATAKDQNDNVMEGQEFSYEVSPADLGTFDGNVFTPSKSGKATITVTCGDKQAQVSFYCGISPNLAFSPDISTNNKVIAQSDKGAKGTDAFYAVDGNRSSVWQGSSTDGTAADEASRTYDSWFTVDLGGLYDLDAILIYFEGAWSADYTLQVSEDNAVWRTVYTQIGGTNILPEAQRDQVIDNFDASVNRVQYVKFHSTKAATQYGMKIFEFYVFGEISSSTIVSVTGVSLNKTVTSLMEGTQETLTATVAPADATNNTVEWTSSNTDIATVANGVVTAVAPGEATITATTVDGGFTATCVVTVTADPFASDWVVLENGANRVKYLALHYIGSNIYTLTIEGITANVTGMGGAYWYVNGVGSRIDAGKEQISAAAIRMQVESTSAPQMYTPFYVMMPGEVNFGQFTINWLDKEAPATPAIGVELDKTSHEMAVGENYTLVASVLPALATNKNVTWTSSNEAVATVENGVVSAIAAGSTTITVTTIDGGFTATCVVTVVASIEPTVYRASGVFGGDPAVNMTYSITRNADRTLTFVVVLEDAIDGNKEINIGNGYKTMSYDAETLTATFTTETKYADGFKSSEWFFYFGGRRIDFKYEVGYETPEVANDLVVNGFRGMCVDGDVAANNFVGAEFYEVEYKVGSETCVTSISLRQVEHLVGGKGYIVFATAPSLFCNFNGALGKTATYDDSSDAIHVNRTSSLEDVPENAGCFLLINNKLYECGTGCKVRPGSIYIRMANVGTEPSAAPGRRRVIGNAQAPSTPTALDNISDDNDVEARKVVVDGNVFILRGNRIYNTMGQLVK